MEHVYRVQVQWNADRRGTMCSPELSAPALGGGCLEVATPPEFPKGIAGIWSPEHLFTASVASCLMTTFLAVAENSKLDFTSFLCEAEGKLAQVDGKFLMTEVLLKPTVTIPQEKDQERALRVLQKSEAACLISNSVKSTVTMVPKVEVVLGEVV